MARLIDADALIKRYDLHIVIGAGDNICIDIADIAKAPTVDAVPVVHGRWVTDEKGVTYCGRCRIIDDYASVHNYCPNCGAKLDLEVE